LELIVNQLKSRSGIPELLQNCCFALGNLLPPSEMDISFSQLIEGSGIIQIMTETMKKHFHDRKLLHILLFTLGNLARDFDELVFACDGLQIAFQTIKSYPDPILVVDALFILKNIAYGEKGSQFVLSNFGVVWISDVLTKFSSDAKVVHLALSFIYDLSFSCQLDPIVQLCGLAILSALQVHAGNLRLVKEGLKTLSRLYLYSSQGSQISLLKTGLVQNLRKIALEFPENKKIQTILQRISQKFVSHERIPLECAPSLLELAAQKIKANPQIDQRFLCDDLKNLLAQGKICSSCGKYYFNYYFEVLVYEVFPELKDLPMPSIKVLCSKQCEAQLKQLASK